MTGYGRHCALPSPCHCEERSDEPINDTGDGDTEPDWEIGTDEDGNPTLALRAERAGNGDGRVYTILVSIESWAGYSLWNGSYYAP
jgi:hypothetical protein